MRESGSSIVEVIVMMLIISISIVGIYSMVNNGQRLAILTDDRLTAINIAKEGIESIGALRDTFALRAYGATNCFFTIDGTNYGDCPLLNSSTGISYILTDDKNLKKEPESTIGIGDYTVCVNQDGWYSQTHLDPDHICSSSVDDLCGGGITTNCRTRFSRRITFQKCSNPADLNQCIMAKVEIRWGNEGDKNLTLEQLFTRIK